MDKALTKVRPHGEGRFKVEVHLPPRDGIRRTAKFVTIQVDKNADMPEFAECVNIAATGDLAPEEMHEFIEALHLAQRLANGTLVLTD